MEFLCLAKEAENKFRLVDTDPYVIGVHPSQAIERQSRGQLAEEFENKVACSQSENGDPVVGLETELKRSHFLTRKAIFAMVL